MMKATLMSRGLLSVRVCGGPCQYTVLRMRLLFLLFLFVLPLTWATQRMAQRAELAASLTCYAGADPALWDTFIGALPADVVNDVDKLAGKAALLLQQLRARVPPCTALERVTRRSLVGCSLLTNDGPLRQCLGAAHATGRGSLFDPPDRERAAAANARMRATREEALTYASDPDAYSDPVVRSVVAAVTRQYEP